jgi:hypothetical protein
MPGQTPTATTELVPQSQSPDGAALLDRVSQFIGRHLRCSEHQLTYMALWDLHTYCLPAAQVAPYLSIRSREKQQDSLPATAPLACQSNESVSLPVTGGSQSENPIKTRVVTLLRVLARCPVPGQENQKLFLEPNALFANHPITQSPNSLNLIELSLIKLYLLLIS